MMKLVVLALSACALFPVLAQTRVGISVGISQPGVYGRIEIGDFPPPRVVYPQPVVIAPSPLAVYRRPIYLYVPPGHQQNWAKFCSRYSACGQPVYFVREDWVQERFDEEYGYRGKDERWPEKGKKNKHKRRD